MSQGVSSLYTIQFGAPGCGLIFQDGHHWGKAFLFVLGGLPELGCGLEKGWGSTWNKTRTGKLRAPLSEHHFGAGWGSDVTGPKGFQ